MIEEKMQMSNDLSKKWRSVLDQHKCHPEMRERVAIKLEKAYCDAIVECKNNSFDIEKFSNRLKKIIEPYDRRENTVG